MRAVLQQVRSAAVSVDGAIVGKIDAGYFVLLGVHRADTADDVDWLVNKLCNLRVVETDDGEMSIEDAQSPLLVVSQFTLHGSAAKGRRPSWFDAAPPEVAEPLVDAVVDGLRERLSTVETGTFRAMMEISADLTGPWTLIVDSPTSRT